MYFASLFGLVFAIVAIGACWRFLLVYCSACHRINHPQVFSNRCPLCGRHAAFLPLK